MATTITRKDTEPQDATRWRDDFGGTWEYDGWGKWVCTVNGVPFFRHSWETIPRRMFPMTKVQ